MVASSNHLDTSCTLIGSPAVLKLNGTERPGRPVRLKGTVARIMCVDGTLSPFTTYSSRPGGGAVIDGAEIGCAAEHEPVVPDLTRGGGQYEDVAVGGPGIAGGTFGGSLRVPDGVTK